MLASCGGSNENSDNQNGNQNQSSAVCKYGEYECHGDDSYFCGYPNSSNEVMWLLAERCSNGCNSSTGKCENSDNNGDDSQNSDPSEDGDQNHENSRTKNCEPKPANSVWNDNGAGGKFEQTWNGSEWVPEIETTYNKTPGKCVFICAEGFYWNNNSCETAPTRNADCTDLPENAEWNTASSITQTFDGEDWTPSNVGTYNKTASSSECRFKCKQNYTWNSAASSCYADTNTATCDELPENAEWNSVSTITQTWNGTEWIPSQHGTYNEAPSSTECRFKCKENYNWDGSSCVADKRTSECTGLPENAVWNIVSSITQNWNGSTWTPSTNGIYDINPSASECRYACAQGYTRENDNCINQKTASCTGLPSGASWNTVSSITQNWNGSEWLPTNIGSFNSTASTNECRFQCNPNYTWQIYSLTCQANSKVSNCTGLPDNAEWNSVSTISQTWNGEEWSPSANGSYNKTASTTECRFKCKTSHVWTGSKCLYIPSCSPTSGTPCVAGPYIWSKSLSACRSCSGCYGYSESGLSNGWRLPQISDLITYLKLPCTVNSCRVYDECLNNCYTGDGECCNACHACTDPTDTLDSYCKTGGDEILLSSFTGTTSTQTWQYGLGCRFGSLVRTYDEYDVYNNWNIRCVRDYNYE